MQRQITLSSTGTYQLQMKMRLKTMHFYNSASHTVSFYLSEGIGSGGGIQVPAGMSMEIETFDTEDADYNEVLFSGTAADTFVVFWSEYPTQKYCPVDASQPFPKY